MIIAVTGTPCTGKDTFSSHLGRCLGWKAIDLNNLARQKGFIRGYDRKRKCDIVDIKGLGREIKKLKGNFIIQSHYSHLLPSDVVVVLMADPKELRRRMMERGWPEEKIQENIDAEIMEVCKTEALERSGSVIEIDSTEEVDTMEAINKIFLGLKITKPLKLTEKNTDYFKRPYGTLFSALTEAADYIEKRAPAKLISVGDATSHALITAGIVPDIIIVDNKEKRQPFTKPIKFSGKEFKAINRPGSISPGLWNSIRKALLSESPVRISVIGEEDLAVLPSVVLAPLGSIVAYGQPPIRGGEGIVVIDVTKEKKIDSVNLVDKIRADSHMIAH